MKKVIFLGLLGLCCCSCSSTYYHKKSAVSYGTTDGGKPYGLTDSKIHLDESYILQGDAGITPPKNKKTKSSAWEYTPKENTKEGGNKQAGPWGFATFPWPPPRPTTTYCLPSSLFKYCKKFVDVSEMISNALDNSGYNTKSYYYIPGGFAIATQVEQIDKSGFPKKPDSERWDLDYRQARINSFMDYLNALFTSGKPGLYRCIVFMVTDSSFKNSGQYPSDSLTESLPLNGNNKLPRVYGQLRLNEGFKYAAYIYEIQKNSSSSKVLAQSNISAGDHLKNSNIYKYLYHEN